MGRDPVTLAIQEYNTGGADKNPGRARRLPAAAAFRKPGAASPVN